MGLSGSGFRRAAACRRAGQLDYADQRYFSGLQGQFLSADPYEASSGAAAPGSLGRYAYVQSDPVTNSDPNGLNLIAVMFSGGDPRDAIAQCGGGGGVGWDWGIGWPGGGGVPVNDFLGTYQTNARIGLGQKDSFSLFGFKNAKDAQSAFDKIKFNYVAMGKLNASGGAPTSQPHAASTLGYGTVNSYDDHSSRTRTSTALAKIA